LTGDLQERMARMEARQEKHEHAHDEFMLRTDLRLETIIKQSEDRNAAIGRLVKQSDEWSGVRKTLAVLVTLITIVGGAIGWTVHEFSLHLARN